MNGLRTGGKYVPSSAIRTEPLTSKYALEGEIGRGKFAVVRKCTDLGTGELFAAKFIRKRSRGKSSREEILREVVMLEYAMSHPRLVSLQEVYETPTELILVTEYCSGGELFHECVIEESFEEKDVIRLLVQILEGLCFLHENNIVHLDLKPQNILLTEPFPKGSVKICDLGFACLTDTGEDIRDIIGTPDYVAPEVLDYEPLSIQSDMWSLGVLAYVMLTACSPFAGNSPQETFCNISQINLDFPAELFSHISPQAQDFISALLVKDPRDRMTARQCLEHAWLKSAGAEMHVSLPAVDHTVSLAQQMVPPSNLHSSKHNSIDHTFDSSASLGSASAKDIVDSDCHTPHGQPSVHEDNRQNDGEFGIVNENQSALASSSIHDDELTSKTFEGIGIDSAKFLATNKNHKDFSSSEKRQSVEIPLKKAKCCSDSEEVDKIA